MRRPTGIFAAICIGALQAATAQAQDHPLLSPYAGSTINSRKVEELGTYKFVNGLDDKGNLVSEVLKGKVTRIVYRNPADRSTLEIFTHYEKALTGKGMGTMWSCALDECGPAYAVSPWGRYNGLFAAADGDPRYLAGRIAGGKILAYLAIMVGRTRTQVDIVEIAAMQEAMVAFDAEGLGAGLDRDGRVSIYGIFFDTGQSTIKPESKATLDQIAALLKSRPALKLYVVGHTDMAGALAHNRTLSVARARAVVNALVKSYGIAAARLEGHGVGPLAPVASNAEEAGRAKNRRVELVERK
jgi:OmpA-OmpF porin, OOP family